MDSYPNTSRPATTAGKTPSSPPLCEPGADAAAWGGEKTDGGLPRSPRPHHRSPQLREEHRPVRADGGSGGGGDDFTVCSIEEDNGMEPGRETAVCVYTITQRPDPSLVSPTPSAVVSLPDLPNIEIDSIFYYAKKMKDGGSQTERDGAEDDGSWHTSQDTANPPTKCGRCSSHLEEIREREELFSKKEKYLSDRTPSRRWSLPSGARRKELTICSGSCSTHTLRASPAGRIVAPHLRTLACCGFFWHRPCPVPLAPATPPARFRRALFRLYQTMTLAGTSLYLLQQGLYAYTERGDSDKLGRVMFLLLCHFTSIVKQLVFYRHGDAIDDLISRLEDPHFDRNEGAARRMLCEAARSAGRLARVYPGAAVATCLLWGVLPALQRLQGRRVQFPIWVPRGWDESAAGFTAVLLYSYYATSLVGVANTTMDAFFGALLSQCRTQLKILRMDYESLERRARAVARETGEPFDAALSRRFAECQTHYGKITDLLEALQALFGIAIMVQFTISAWILCLAGYKMLSLSLASIEFASMVLFISCILTELFVYCYFGNELTAESECLSAALYASRWKRCAPRHGRLVAAAMLRAQRPLQPRAARFVPLSLDTFLKIVKSSYSFYAVLRQTK